MFACFRPLIALAACAAAPPPPMISPPPAKKPDAKTQLEMGQ